MLDFACKEFELDDVFKCALNLTRSELKIMNKFLENDDTWFTSDDIAVTMGLDLSTVQKAVKKLYTSDVLNRSQKNLDNGGYVYIYKARSREEMKKLVLSIVHIWVNRVENEFDNWINEKQNYIYAAEKVKSG
ncbi:transcriptional regulator, TrmB [Methanohalobium evestigatum Z-7303]|uniref:Transcriptional regulator, TrmB n=1 Tax=Methanohalobium evestigatum (strain ATCC BAA-1072 / DSM 3721 / NBRC 107634 / OCM 161 / Z-7303) TaxID=644295 RepID=D7E7S4_METEZ|nr:TrmB family transcriptional regulator [Methanohalobium evestigatum]ADI74147.1 transcriptional regulator, TrmB [Methanohalobium evestigatum Z-7303]